jgi:uncharacterized phosphosugar-binding protein
MKPNPYWQKFREHVDGLFDRIATESAEGIEKAAAAMVGAIERDAIIHVCAAGGHSQIPAMEFFLRAGGLANVSMMFAPGLGLFDGKPCLERVAGMGGATMAYHDVRPEDVVMVCNYYGMNAATIDLALAAKNRRATVIGLTSVQFGRTTPSDFIARHPSKKNLEDIADIIIDTHTSAAEQLLSIPGVAQRVGVASSIAACFAIQLLNLRVVELASQRGIDVPLWMSANHPGGDETNLRYMRKYMPRVRHLYPEGEDYIGQT